MNKKTIHNIVLEDLERHDSYILQIYKEYRIFGRMSKEVFYENLDSERKNMALCIEDLLKNKLKK